MIDYLNGDGGRFTLGSAVVDEVSNRESEGWKFVLISWFMWFFNQAFVERTRRSGKDSHRDEGVEAAESGAHGLDADGGSKNDLVQEDGAERNPDIANIVLLGIVVILSRGVAYVLARRTNITAFECKTGLKADNIQSL